LGDKTTALSEAMTLLDPDCEVDEVESSRASNAVKFRPQAADVRRWRLEVRPRHDCGFQIEYLLSF